MKKIKRGICYMADVPAGILALVGYLFMIPATKVAQTLGSCCNGLVTFDKN